MQHCSISNPFKNTEKEEDPIYLRDGPVYETTVFEMGNLPELLRSLDSGAVKYGDVLILPRVNHSYHSTSMLFLPVLCQA